MKALGSVASVVEAVREEVESRVAGIRQESEAQREGLEKAAAAAPIELAERPQRLAQERLAVLEGLGREDWADRREALEDREAFLTEVVRSGLSRLKQPAGPQDQRALLRQLIVEALGRLPGEVFEVALSPADAPLAGEDFRSEIARRCRMSEIRLAADRLDGAGGCLVRTGDGRAAFDNTFEARSRRFESVWRAALAEIYGP